MSADLHSRNTSRPARDDRKPLTPAERVEFVELCDPFASDRPRVLLPAIIGLVAFAVLWVVLIVGSLRGWW